MSRALVLNATYEPLAVVPARRAVVLVLDGKADLVHGAGEQWRAESMTVAVPSVVRLRYFVRAPFHRQAPLSRRAVFLRDDGRCQYCGRNAESIDHVVPRSKGGPHSWDNVVAACRRCNTSKRDRLLEDTGMRLRRRPETPRHLSWVTVSVGAVPEPWSAYLQGPATAALGARAG